MAIDGRSVAERSESTREFLMIALPSPQTLDGKVVTLEERQHAQRLYPDLVSAPPVDTNFVTPIAPTSPAAAAKPAPATPSKPKVTHSELSALFSSDSATLNPAGASGTRDYAQQWGSAHCAA